MKQAESLLARTGKEADKMSRQIGSALNSTSSAVQNAGARLKTLTDTMRAQAAELNSARSSAETYKNRVNELSAAEASQRNQIEATKARITELKNQYRQLAEQMRMPNSDPGGTMAIRAQMDGLATSIANERSALSGQTEALGGLQGRLEAASGLFAEASGKAQTLTGALAETAQAAGRAKLALTFTKVGAALGSVGSRLKGVVANLSGFNMIKGIANHFRQVASAGEGLNGVAKSLGRSLFSVGNIIKGKLISTALNAVFKNLGTSMKSLAGHSSSVNNALSKLSQGAKGISASLAGAFAPILSAVQPILSKLVSMVTEAINAVNQFFAKLTGASSWKKAVVALQSYAGAAGSAGNAAGGAADAAEKLKRSVLGFDALNKLDDQSSSSGGGSDGGGGGGGGGGAGDGISWVDMPIDNEIAKFAEMFKEAWENADFYDIGRIVGEKLRDALDSIPWDEIKATCNKVAKSVATFLNGFFETPGLFEAVGRTIGESLNTVIGTVHTFLDNLHTDSIGKAITTAIFNAVKTLDFKDIGALMSDIPKKLMDFVRGGIEGVEWSEVPSMIVQKIKDFFEGYDFAGVAESLKNLLSSAWDAAVALFKATGDLAVPALVSLTKSGWTTLKAFVGDKVEAALSLVKSGWSSLKAFVGEKVEAAVSLAKDGWSTLKAFVGSAVSVAVSLAKSGWSSLTGFVGSAVEATVTLAKSGWTTVKAFVETYAGSAIEAAVKLTKSGWTTVKALVGTVEDVIVNVGAKILSSFTDAKQKWIDFKGTLGEAVKNVGAKVEQTYTAAKEGWDNFVGGFKTATKDIYASIMTSFKDAQKAWEEWKDKAVTLTLKALDKVTEIIEKILKGVYNVTINLIPEWMKDTDKDPIKNNITQTADSWGITDDGFVIPIIPEVKEIDVSKNLQSKGFEITGTGVINQVQDKLTPAQKILKDFNSWVSNLTDKVPLASKIVDGIKAQFTGYELAEKFNKKISMLSRLTKYELSNKFNKKIGMISRLTSKEYGGNFGFTVRGMTAYLANKSIGFGLTISGMLASITRAQDNIPFWAKVISGFKAIFTSKGGVVTASGGLYSNGWHPVQNFATGGTPLSGQMFIAREAGPELVGSLNGHTAVMNNNQIVSSVAAGVAQAVSSVLTAQGRSSGDVVVYIDSTELARATLKGQRVLDKQMNPRVVFG